jgi:hypothetical protein
MQQTLASEVHSIEQLGQIFTQHPHELDLHPLLKNEALMSLLRRTDPQEPKELRFEGEKNTLKNPYHPETEDESSDTKGFALRNVAKLLRINCPQLKTLKLRGWTLCCESLEALLSPLTIPALETLDISKCSFNDFPLSLRVVNPHIRTLIAKGVFPYDYQESAKFRTCFFSSLLSALPGLGSVSLMREPVGLTGEFLERFSQHNSGLYSFSISCFEEGFDRGRLQFKDKHLNSFIGREPLLRELRVHHGVSLSEATTRCALENLHELELLELNFHEQVFLVFAFSDLKTNSIQYHGNDPGRATNAQPWTELLRPNLRVLRLFTTPLAQSFLTALVGFRHLTELALPRVATGKGQFERAIEHLRLLEIVCIASDTLSSNALCALARLPKMRRLMFYSWKRPRTLLNEESASALAASSIEELHFIGEDLTVLLSKIGEMQNLRILHLVNACFSFAHRSRSNALSIARRC